VRVTIASTVLAGIGYGVWRLLDELLGRGFAGQLSSVGGALLAGGAAYLVCCRLLRVRELGALLTLLDRFRRR
jgi:hypothetical protein